MEETEKMAVQAFLDAIPNEGEEATPAESSPVKEDEKVDPIVEEKDDKEPPFHKHPRWKQKQEEIQHLSEEVNRLKQQIEIKPKTPIGNNTIPKWFTDRFGEDQEAWESYENTIKSERSEWMKEAVEELRQESVREKEEQVKSQEKMEAWVQDSLQELKDDGEKFDENKLLKILTEFSPTDSQGNIDFKKGLVLLRQLETNEVAEKKEKVQARKEVASATSSNTKGGKESKIIPAKEIRKMSWNDITLD